MRKLLGHQHLRRGNGIFSTVQTRRAERLFGLKGSGRVKMGLVGAVKLEKLRGDGFMGMILSRTNQAQPKNISVRLCFFTC